MLRQISVSAGDVYCKCSNGKEYRLEETKQIFNDGRERRRNLPQAISEKIKPDETPEETMLRGINEELGLHGNVKLTKIGVNDQTGYSNSYPGLLWCNGHFVLVKRKKRY